MEYRIVYLKDMKDVKFCELFEKIKDGNPKLYNALYMNLEKDSSLGIRDDVLTYMAECIEDFNNEPEYAYSIADFATNIKVTPACLAWINEYFSDNAEIGIGDFQIVFSEAIEKDIPLEKIKDIFSEKPIDIIGIYQKVEEYSEKEINVLEEEEEHDNLSQVDDNLVVGSVHEEHHNKVSGYEDVVGNLLTVMTHKNRNENEIRNAQENMNKNLAKFQNYHNEIAAYVTEIIRAWEKDKEENVRLQALLEIQQKILSNQQMKINELRNENVQLNERILVATRAEMQLQAIGQKLAEYQAPTEDMRNYNSAFLSGK